jgi:hypothetical protein
MFKNLATLLLFLLLTSGCAQAITPALTPQGSSGIEGYVTQGPMCPGPVPVNGSTECADQPYQATITILDSGSNEVARIQSDTAGYFKLTLAPGTYTLHPISEKVLPHASDQQVTVIAGEYTQVNVMYDTGMR